MREVWKAYPQVRSTWHMPPGPQSVSTRHSTQAWVAVSQAGVPVGQLALLVQVAPQVWPLEQVGVPPEQSAPDRQSTQLWLAT